MFRSYIYTYEQLLLMHTAHSMTNDKKQYNLLCYDAKNHTEWNRQSNKNVKVDLVDTHTERAMNL